LGRVPDLVDLALALVNIGLLILVGRDESLVNAGVLNFELLEVVDINDGVTEFVEVALNILELVLVES
jgi:hypothetical protein